MDTNLALERVKYRLETEFQSVIDVSDITTKDPDQAKAAFLSRALAAFCLASLVGADPRAAGAAVTDAFDDGGLDAIYFDDTDRSLYLVQSKWSKNASKGIEEADCHKFLNGYQSLIRLDFSGFNAKIKKREAELRSVIMRSDVRIVLVLAYVSQQPISDHVQRPINQVLERENSVEDKELVSLEVVNLPRAYTFLSGSAATARIKLQIGLAEWGRIDAPYLAYYGQMKVSDVASWGSYGKSLLDKNIRFYRGSTDVNEALARTIQKEPSRFWYFNNGLTIICSKIEKVLLNGDSRDYGVFDCDGVCVVNGGQTVGVICEGAKRNPPYFQSLDAKVHVRLISLENCPDGFATEVARATNTQNRIQHRDFAALDPNQQRLAIEMQLDAKRYAYKSGDEDPKGNDGCGIEEATVALACANGDISFAVLAKREVGRFWLDTSDKPYLTLFNDELQVRQMWLAVRILAVSEALEELDASGDRKDELLAVHGNRFILYRVFLDSRIRGFRSPVADGDQIVNFAKEVTRQVFARLAEVVKTEFSNAYLANLFKNSAKCEVLDKKLSEDDPDKGTLFERTISGGVR